MTRGFTKRWGLLVLAGLAAALLTVRPGEAAHKKDANQARDLTARIDQRITARLDAEKVPASPRADDAEFLRSGEERTELRFGQLPAIDVGIDLDAAQPEVVHAATHFRDGQFGRLHRHRAHADKAIGVFRHGVGHRVVDGARNIAADAGVGEIEILTGRGADRLHVDAETIHVGEAAADAVQFRRDGGEQVLATGHDHHDFVATAGRLAQGVHIPFVERLGSESGRAS